MDCWGNNPKQVPQQKDEGAHTKVISYLNELAMCCPSRKSWDELVWPPQSTMPVSPHERVSVSYLQGHVMELGPAMPPHSSASAVQVGHLFTLPGHLSLKVVPLLMTPPLTKPSGFL